MVMNECDKCKAPIFGNRCKYCDSVNRTYDTSCLLNYNKVKCPYCCSSVTSYNDDYLCTNCLKRFTITKK